MIGWLKSLFGDNNDREIKRLSKTVDEIEALEPYMKELSDDELRAKTEEFRGRLFQGETLDDLLVEAFAVVRETSVRVLGMRHFRVQLLGGIVLHQGRIAEMKTGEGKTLVATLPAYLNALDGKGVHIVTVNDYLASRDSEWMGKIYKFLGLTVGLIVNDMKSSERRESYACDIVYGTNNEFGFDYLRDNMVIYKEEMVQRQMNFAVIDEVDSILIDEARTPLIISGAGDKSTDMYFHVDRFLRTLKSAEYYEKDEKANTVNLTEEGVSKAEEYFNIENLADPDNSQLSHHIYQGLKAHTLMKRDIDYVVKDDQVLIVDEFTGRLMTGRRYSDGLHQAIEAKEGVKVKRESKTLATITFQNYFRMYNKLSGMTGTAKTEEQEFQGIYGLDVVEIPTNMPMIRQDHNDIVYMTMKGKYEAVIEEIVKCHEIGQPVLVGTISIEDSELISAMLRRGGIPHEVLNAKYHEKEAEIIAQAGKFGAVTIATNMAGRGTDIILGGNPEFLAKNDMKRQGYPDTVLSRVSSLEETEDRDLVEARLIYNNLFEKYEVECENERQRVLDAGGLHIIGTERHESRRIDNQLRGRAGRQGDPGSSRFYISLEDDLMRLFGSDRIRDIVGRLGIEEEQSIEYGMLSRQIEQAQRRVEGANFDTRRHVLQYDDVMNIQRETIYSQRRRVLEGENLKDSILDMLNLFVEDTIASYCEGLEYPGDWNIDGIIRYLENVLLVKGFMEIPEEEIHDLTRESLKDRILDVALDIYEKKEEEVGSEVMREAERVILLKTVDQKWMDHIDAMDQLRQGIGLRAYGQRDPVIEYKLEGYEMFQEMVTNIQADTLRGIYSMQIEAEALKREKVAEPIHATHGNREAGPKEPVVKGPKIGRNDPCPCGSGRKYKRCCGSNL